MINQILQTLPAGCKRDGIRNKITELEGCIDYSPEVEPTEGIIAFLQSVNDVLSLVSWIAGIIAIFVVVIIGIRIIGARATNNAGASAAALGGLPWVFVGLIIVLSAAQIVSFIF